MPNYKLVFNRKGTYRPGGVASIERSGEQESSMYGIIWRLCSQDLLELDRIEDPKAYERVPIEAQLLDGGTYECQTYPAYPEATHVSPDPEYLDLLLQAAKPSGLPDDYVQRISRFRERLS